MTISTRYTLNSSSARRTAGKHRKQSPNKGRVALVAVATGAVASGGISAASAANADHASAAQAALEDASEAAAQAAPQILTISEYKPVDNLSEQLGKAVEYAKVRSAADEAARAPLSVKPAEGAFTSGFGSRWGTIHKGVDIANAIGTPIVAVTDGEVIDAGPASGFGNWVRLRHEDGTITVYGHMETVDVTVGEKVRAGQKIAGMGSRGFSTGSHLHFEVYPNGGDAIDPAPWLAARGIKL
ncbi:Murein DD-endopeptidase MepM and murein hydrolase activator NlpD, contain LysM domain [Corynebacterium appendicis CIP 107643]|uniref:Murein DD-endopeptidase MepM and murein hydrolase activator NlpD, contain LysM domain n=1 Tax=Corynebacterium appendicis CIP 107643 TaxID=1161099 RepID=A0A1N7JDI7_9CORY|nr:M23 family metallopeptidase [Corynebacterium appendicis]MCT1684616.1 M23 family metallopeptidase [Corynebacterium appendicis]WJY60615.1 Murein hydrolase activator NlpD precursor [Corynebacterium appendicis CIP 107643]SIS47311.1 Murein DD-endopeptidase MepM and murein hydrolase activator NlpD, contain LysM domain [Corynebacterium appendicis CIP 107643]